MSDYSINERILSVRKALGLTQKDFGASIGVGKDVIANLDGNRTSPKPLLIQQICKVHNVSRDWLETGDGDMFMTLDDDEQLAEIMGMCIRESTDPRKRRMLKTILEAVYNLPDEYLPAFAQFLASLSSAAQEREEDAKKPPTD